MIEGVPIKRRALVVIAAVGMLVVAGCATTPTPELPTLAVLPSLTPSLTPSDTPTPTLTPTPSDTPVTPDTPT
ncbi:MAG: adhesin, partial [Chloroflexota bacterium]